MTALHRDAVRVLGEWAAPDEPQEKSRIEFLEHLAVHTDGMWRECVPGHLTASTAVLDPSGTKVLLTLHRKLKMWLQLGGHCEPGDLTLAGAALREATEESGIEGLVQLPEPVSIDRHLVPCHPGGSFHYDVQYTAIAPHGAQERISDESDALAWFPIDALPAQTDDALRRLVARSVQRLP